MPDLTEVYLQACATRQISQEFESSKGTTTYHTVVFLEEGLDDCDCPGWQYRGKCRHVTELREKLCGWDQQHSPEVQTPQQEMMAECPKCGGETCVYRAGV